MLFRIVNKFHQEVFSDPNVPNGLNRSIDFRAVTLEHDRLLTSYRQEWAERFEQDSDHSGARDPPLSLLGTADICHSFFRWWYRCGLRVPCQASSLVRCRSLLWRFGPLISRGSFCAFFALQLRELREARHVLVWVPKGIPAGLRSRRRGILHEGKNLSPSSCLVNRD